MLFRRFSDSLLFTSNSTGARVLRRTSLAQFKSSLVSPTRPSTTNKTASDVATASIAMLVESSAIPEFARSRPAVSYSVYGRSRKTPEIVSRVTPGRSCTSASRVPVNALKSVDLPVFGRPAMVIFNIVFFR